MSRPLSLTVPSLAETAATGFVGAGARVIRGQQWRAEVWVSDGLRLFKNNKRVESVAYGPAIALMRDTAKVFAQVWRDAQPAEPVSAFESFQTFCAARGVGAGVSQARLAELRAEYAEAKEMAEA